MVPRNDMPNDKIDDKYESCASLPNEALIEFIEIYKLEYGLELKNDIAIQKALSVLNMFSLLGRK